MLSIKIKKGNSGMTKTYKALKNKMQVVATYYFIMLMLGSTCFGHN